MNKINNFFSESGSSIVKKVVDYKKRQIFHVLLTGGLYLVGTALIITLFTSLFLISLTHLQHQALLPVDNSWRVENEDIFNAITVSISIFVIFLVSWLYNRKLHKVLEKVILSEKLLEKEKRLLKKRVKKQTRQIRLAQIEKMMQWQQFVEVGRSAIEIFHDIKNPLTSASLNLEQLYNNRDLSKSKLKKIKLAFENIQFIGKFINSTQLQLSNQNQIIKFSPAKYIKQAIRIMSPKADINHVDIIIRELDSSLILGPANKFAQVIINLISNSIDSYYQIERKQNRQIIINFSKNQKKLVLKIQDFGAGISTKNKQKIFEPMYTTKNPNMGIGLGLTITKNTIENIFKGTISCNSAIKKGTTFTVAIPI